METNIISETLKKCELFSGLSDEELSPFVASASVEEYKEGDIVYEQGNFGTKLYVLVKGQVSLIRRSSLAEKTTATSTVYMFW